MVRIISLVWLRVLYGGTRNFTTTNNNNTKIISNFYLSSLMKGFSTMLLPMSFRRGGKVGCCFPQMLPRRGFRPPQLDQQMRKLDNNNNIISKRNFSKIYVSPLIDGAFCWVLGFAVCWGFLNTNPVTKVDATKKTAAVVEQDDDVVVVVVAAADTKEGGKKEEKENQAF
jgi:hypothetical protein